MAEIVVCEEHSQVYDTWRERGASALDVVHVDFHCDMRGLLVDRRAGRAHLIGGGDVPRADSGNFLGVAVLEGLVRSIRWVHDAHGGRRFDAGTVKYEFDLSALPHRLRHRRDGASGHPLAFEELDLEDWDGMRPGEQLDVDWDGLASIEYPRARTEALTSAFLEREWSVVPETTFLVYSPGYSDPDRSLFEDFIERLATRFAAEVRRLPAPALPPGYPKPPQDLALGPRLKHRLVLGLHRLGIH